MSTTFTLVRHGETEWNATGRIQGASDIPLNKTGVLQAVERAPYFQNKKYDIAYSSPLERAVKTMEIIQTENNMTIPIQLDSRLVERHFGKYEGAEVQVFRDDLMNDTISDTYETDAHIIARVGEALTEIAHKSKGKNILVTAHSHVLKAMLKYVNDEDFSFRQGLANLGVCEFIYHHDDQKWNITYEETTERIFSR